MHSKQMNKTKPMRFSGPPRAGPQMEYANLKCDQCESSFQHIDEQTLHMENVHTTLNRENQQ